MEDNHPVERIEEPQVPEVEASLSSQDQSVQEFVPGTLDLDVAQQFAAIHEDYGRERLRTAMRRGLNGPAMLCAASLGMFFIWRLIIPEAVLYCVAVASLVRVLKMLRATTILDAREKASWNQRLALTTAFVTITGLVYVIFILFVVMRVFFYFGARH